jgi:protein AroM
MKKVGFITIGQSPRTDITSDISSILDNDIELFEAGALDEYSYDEIIEKFSPRYNEGILVSRLRDGREVKISQASVEPVIQEIIEKFEEKNINNIVLLCTGQFGEIMSTKTLIKPQGIIYSLTSQLANERSVSVLYPDKKQSKDMERKWGVLGLQIDFFTADPYGDISEIENVAHEIKKKDNSLLVMDCLGYSIEMKNIIKSITNKSILLPRTILASIINELV